MNKEELIFWKNKYNEEELENNDDSIKSVTNYLEL